MKIWDKIKNGDNIESWTKLKIFDKIENLDKIENWTKF